MPPRLKLQDVITRGRLTARTAKYVLTHANLRGLPAGGGKGRHRAFDVDQAVRLAIATQLVMNGVPLEAATEVTGQVERTVKARSRAERAKASTYDSSLGDPWVVRILDGRYVQVWRGKGHELFDDDAYFSTADGKGVRHPDIGTPVSEGTINLTWLEALIMRDDSP